MTRYVILIAALFIFALLTQAKANTELKDEGKAEGLEIVVTSLEITNKALNMTYDIRNESEDDIWIYTGSFQPTHTTFGMDATVHVVVDQNILTIDARLKKPDYRVMSGISYGRFVRLRAGKNQVESIFMELPVHPASRFGQINEQGQDLEYATYLAVELSYYSGSDLPERILKMREEQEKKRPIDSRSSVLPDYFSTYNECLMSRDDELLKMGGGIEPVIEIEKILKTVIDNVRIPYQEVSMHRVTYERPDLQSCTRIEIKYKPSMLDYFFPFDFQKNLLSPEELKYLQSERSHILEDTAKINAITSDVNKAVTKLTLGSSLIGRYRSHVDVICDYDSKPQMSFLIYNDDTIGFDGNLLPCFQGFLSLKMLTPRVQAIDLRMRCAVNLKNLWFRFHLYHFHEAVRLKDPSIRERIIYPATTQWCDNILRSYPDGGVTWWKETHVCPSAGEGKNHYAMNPNCEPNSSGDMVLLFETKAGWNQHGGPELFTFDNHDPKGGCVLLNDGTVKFIRTKEELNTLRWK